jgi:phosphate transport system substrate-binding protein
VQNKSGKFIAASTSSTTAALTASAGSLAKDVRNPIANSTAPDGYPICGLTFLLVYQDTKNAAKAKTLADFLDWAIHDGQAFAEDLDYAKLPDAVVKVDEAAIKSLTAAGKPVLAAR